jgi:acetylornithine deacetylase
VGRIEGGTSVNIVPDWCAIDIDRRVLPAEIVDELLVDAKQFVQSRVDFEFDMQPPTSGGLPLDNSNNGPFAELLGRSIESVTGGQKAIGVAYTTHAPRFAATGMPTVVFGPGSIEQAHTKDEWIEVDQMDKATEILIHFLTHLVPGTQ